MAAGVRVPVAERDPVTVVRPVGDVHEPESYLSRPEVSVVLGPSPWRSGLTSCPSPHTLSHSKYLDPGTRYHGNHYVGQLA